MMNNKMLSAVAKGMVIGALVGGATAYVTGLDLTCNCRKIKKKVCGMYRSMCKIMSR